MLFFHFQKFLGCIDCMFWAIVHLYYKALSNQLCCIWLNLWAESMSLYTSELIRLLLSSVTSSINASHTVPLEAMHAHAITLFHHVSQMMLCTFDHELFRTFSILFSSINKLILIATVQRMIFQKWSVFCYVFFFCQSLIWPCLHLDVNPLYLLLWHLLLIVEFDSDTPTSWRLFFTWLDVVNVQLFILLNQFIFSSFLRMYQTVDLALQMFLLSL